MRLSLTVSLMALLASMVGGPAVDVAAQEDHDPIYPAAVLPFQERGSDIKDMGQKVSDLLFAELATQPALFLVDRQEMDTVLDELELSVSGMVQPGEANRLGHMTGAKILITGSVLQVNSTLYLIAKVVGTETTRVVGASVKGSVNDNLDVLVEKLATSVIQSVVRRADQLVAKPITRQDRLVELRRKLNKDRLPGIAISVAEKHIGGQVPDPAVATELTLICRELGFEVFDVESAAKSKADVILSGEAVSEFATRRGNLAAVRGRVEVKATERSSGRVLAAERQTSIALDLSEQLAGKTALQDSTLQLAERLLPRIVAEREDGEKKGRRRRSKDK
jgi:TolB-like protein